jgi:Sulfotransferase domain
MATPTGTGASSTDTIDFLVIGAPKSGTTSLFEYLRGHPEIDLPPDKEVPYFSDDRVYGRTSWEEYLRKWAFPMAKRGRVSGTITPHYMTPITGVAAGPNGEPAYDSQTLPRRIHEQLPSARLIAILRDPVERAYSHHAQETRTGAETRSFADAVDELLRPEQLARSRASSTRTDCYVVLGEYGRILGAYRDLFPRERILVLLTADLERDPLEALRRIYDFLEVSPDYEPRNLGKRYNVAGAEFKLSPDLPRRMVRTASANPLARAAWRSLSPTRRGALLDAHRRFSFRFRNWNRRGATSAPRPSAEVVAALERLRDHYAAEQPLLEELLGYPPPWGTGGGGAPAATERTTVD